MNQPTHVLDVATAPMTRCGIKRKDDEALPFVLVRFVPMHVAGHDLTLCPSCAP